MKLESVGVLAASEAAQLSCWETQHVGQALSMQCQSFMLWVPLLAFQELERQ